MLTVERTESERGTVAKLTKRTVESAQAVGEDTVLWDDDLPGFGVRVYATGGRRYLVQYRHAGRSRRLSLGAHGVLTCEQARAMARDALARALRGEDPAALRREAAKAPTVAEIAERYMAEHARTKKKLSSADTDARNLAKHVLPALGRRRVADVTRSDVARLHHAMRKTPGAANRILALLSKLFALCEKWGLRTDGSNPCRHVEKYPERKMERFLSPQELARLGDTLAEGERTGAEPPEAVAAVRLLILTGARRGEILGLRWQDVDLGAGCLRLADSKEGGAKRIPLGVHALSVLGSLSRRSEWALPTARGNGPLSLSKPWARIRRRAGLPDVRLHDLRHSFASVGVAGGDSLVVVGKILGHGSERMTARYAHLSDDPVRAAAERIDARIGAMLDGKPDADVIPLRDTK